MYMIGSAKKDEETGEEQVRGMREIKNTAKSAHDEESFWDASRVLFALLNDVRRGF
jgi:hypothetical protein